jgi:hypothetical protein
MTARALSTFGVHDQTFKGTVYRDFFDFGLPLNTVKLDIYLQQS